MISIVELFGELFVLQLMPMLWGKGFGLGLGRKGMINKQYKAIIVCKGYKCYK